MSEPEAPASGGAYRFPGRPRVADVSTHQCVPLHTGWSCLALAPDAVIDPAGLAGVDQAWLPAVVPGTAASALRGQGTFDFDRVPDFDATDWWYRCQFTETSSDTSGSRVLCLDGLASLAEVWLNGTRVLVSDNMFVAHQVDVAALLQTDNELVIRFCSLTQALGARRPRPRWRAVGIDHQQLRWHRTTLIGRMLGWSPPVKAVGPWRDVRLERRRACEIVGGDIYPVAREAGGAVDAALELRLLDGARITAASLHVGDERVALTVEAVAGNAVVVRGTLEMPQAAHWWPHTHGAQPRYDAGLTLETTGGPVEITVHPIAFRALDVDRSNDGFGVRVNGVAVFCRGACWTTPDVVALGGSESTYRHLLTLARDAGMNMLRVGGTMAYEADVFYDLCDELGILVWQDFMFANMDYPGGDADFAAMVHDEAESVLARLRRHPSIAVLCGNSEVEQQAAMLGMSRDLWINPLFYEQLPRQCTEGMPGVPYCPGSPSGGALPFHVDVGVSPYYGVGAYLRPLDDARRSSVKFTPECLGFANVPDQQALDTLLPNAESPFHHPRWKARVPRDHGSGWDFDDVRDHYMRELFAVDPMLLRYSDMERYVALSRVVTGEVMMRTLGEWRRSASPCRGALVWYFQDMWLGAGFGVVDADGRPKPAYFALKRAMQPVSIAITNEGSNGLHVHLVNERESELQGELSLALLRGASTVVSSVAMPVTLAPRESRVVVADAMLGRFYDTAYAFRFGPPTHEIAVATLRDANGQLLAERFSFPAGWPNGRSERVSLTASAWEVADGVVCVRLRADEFLSWVALDCGAFVPEDNYFHMAPGTERIIVARAPDARQRFAGYAHPMNAFDGTRIVLVDRDAAMVGTAA